MARDLEAMGYNLDCESFITKDSSTNSGKVERYVTKRTKAKFDPNKTASRYNFENVKSNESSDESNDDDSDDDDEESSDNSDGSDDDEDDDDDSSSGDSSEEIINTRYTPKTHVKRAIQNMKEKETVKRVMKEEAREPKDQMRGEISKAHVEYSKGRDGPVLRITRKIDELHKKVALPVNKKRSGINRLFLKKGRVSHGEGSRWTQSEDQGVSGVVPQSHDTMDGIDAIETQRSAATTKSASSKQSMGSKKSTMSTKSPLSRNSGMSKKTETSKQTNITKRSSSSKNTDTSRKSKASSISATTKKSEASALSGNSGNKSKASSMPAVASDRRLSQSSNQTTKAGIESDSTAQNLQGRHPDVQTQQDDAIEYRQGDDDDDEDDDDDNGDDLEEEKVLEIIESNDYEYEKPPDVIDQSDSSEDGPIERAPAHKTTGPTILGFGTIQATDTMTNEGRLEVTLPPHQTPLASQGHSNGVQSKTLSRTDTETKIGPELGDKNKFIKEIIPAVPTGQTEISHDEDLGGDVRGSSDPKLQASKGTERPVVRVSGKESKKKGFFRRIRTPRLAVDPQAPMIESQRDKCTKKAVALETQFPAQDQPSLEDEMPLNAIDEILIEGMSVVRQNELMDDQIFDGNLVDLKKIKGRPIQSKPLLISPRPQPSPRRPQDSKGRGHSRSPARHVKRDPTKQKMPLREPSTTKSHPSLQEPQPPSTHAPMVSFTFPPEEREYEIDIPVNTVEHGNGKKKIQIGKLLGKMFSRKEKKDLISPSEAESQIDLDLSLVDDDEGVDFRIRSPARSFEENIGVVIETDELASGENSSDMKTPKKTVPRGDSVKISTARHGDGAGIEAKIPSDASLYLRNTAQQGGYLEVEVDHEENHGDDIEPILVQSTTGRKSRERQVTFAPSGPKAKDGTEPSKVSDVITAFGDFMRSLTVSAEASPINRPSIPIRPKTNKASSIVGGSVSDTNTIDTRLLQSEYPTNCLESKEDKTKQPVRSMSTLEGIRLAAMSPTLKMKYPAQDEISFAPSQESINVLPSPESRKPLKSALKSPAAKSKSSNKTSATTSPTLNRRVRSTPQPASTAFKSSMATTTTTENGQHAKSLVGSMLRPIDTSLVGRISSFKRETQKHQAPHGVLSPVKILSPNRTAWSNLSAVSPSQLSMSAIPDQEPLSPMNDGDSTVSSLKVPSNLGTFTSMSREWGAPGENNWVTQDEASLWAEVNNAANILGRAMNQVDVKRNQSTDTADDARRLQNLLSDDSAVGDVEQALAILKRHAHRLGVRESDLLLAAAKSDDSEIFSVRSMTLGEEFMYMVNSYFRGGSTRR